MTEKSLYLELSWHLKGEAWWSQTNFDCTIWGGWGSHVGALESLMKLEPSLCTNGRSKAMVVVRVGMWGPTKPHQEPPGLKLMPLPPSPASTIISGCWGGSIRGLSLWATLGLCCKLLFCDLACTFFSCFICFSFSFPKNKKLIVSMYACECGCTFPFQSLHFLFSNVTVCCKQHWIKTSF